MTKAENPTAAEAPLSFECDLPDPPEKVWRALTEPELLAAWMMPNDIKPEAPKLDRLVVKSGGRVFFLRTEDLDWIEAAGNYVRLHLGEEAHLFRETMNNMEARLDGQRFVRIHRSRIVNTDRIKELQPWFNGEYVVVLHNGTRLTLSRGYREKLQERLGKGF